MERTTIHGRGMLHENLLKEKFQLREVIHEDGMSLPLRLDQKRAHTQTSHPKMVHPRNLDRNEKEKEEEEEEEEEGEEEEEEEEEEKEEEEKEEEEEEEEEEEIVKLLKERFQLNERL